MVRALKDWGGAWKLASLTSSPGCSDHGGGGMEEGVHRLKAGGPAGALEEGGSCVPWGSWLSLQSHSMCLQLWFLGEHQILTSSLQTSILLQNDYHLYHKEQGEAKASR